MPIEALTPRLWDHYSNQELCDVSVISSDRQRFRAHKIILASASRYFEALFLGAGKHLHGSSSTGTGGEEMQIQLEAVDAESLACILTSIYHGSVHVGNSNVEALLLASNYLDVAPVKAACCQVVPLPPWSIHQLPHLSASPSLRCHPYRLAPPRMHGELTKPSDICWRSSSRPT